MTSVIRQLLDEISWEGNATKYRGGGMGKENVLTAEVFQALDFLPRSQFLGLVLEDVQERSSGSPQLSTHVEQMTVSVLPGDLRAEEFNLRVQPDVLLTSEVDFVVVEAKAIRRASFQVEQLAREVLVTQRHAQGRHAVLLLVLGTPPPVLVKGVGRLSIEGAVESGMQRIAARVPSIPATDVEVLWTTWNSIADRVEMEVAAFLNPDPSVIASVHRIGQGLTAAIRSHGG